MTDATPSRAAKLRRLVAMWNDEADQIENSEKWTDTGWRSLAAAKRRCAWELETILDDLDA